MAIKSSKSPGEILLNKNPDIEATSFYVIDSGKLGVRADDGEKSIQYFVSFPGTVVGETGVYNLTAKEEKWPAFKPLGRNACVYALEQTEVTQYEPETIATMIGVKDYKIVRELLRTLLDHTYVNWYRLVWGATKPPDFILQLAEKGIAITTGFVKTLKPEHYSGYKEFKDTFLTYYHFRDYSRLTYQRFPTYPHNDGVQAATNMFKELFEKTNPHYPASPPASVPLSQNVLDFSKYIAERQAERGR